jgi:hypothetical protein
MQASGWPRGRGVRRSVRIGKSPPACVQIVCRRVFLGATPGAGMQIASQALGLLLASATAVARWVPPTGGLSAFVVVLDCPSG